MDEQQSSPTPPPQINYVSFYDALLAASASRRITKGEWADNETYGHLTNGTLMIHRDNKDFNWIISEADMVGSDWIIL
jgi:hypothetical protein